MPGGGSSPEGLPRARRQPELRGGGAAPQFAVFRGPCTGQWRGRAQDGAVT